MVLKIGKTDATSEADGTATNSQSFDPPPSKKQKKPEEASHPQAVAGLNQPTEKTASLLCAGCNISDKEAQGVLLLFDDPEEDEKDKKSGEDMR
jgi:hypothetical protein